MNSKGNISLRWQKALIGVSFFSYFLKERKKTRAKVFSQGINLHHGKRIMDESVINLCVLQIKSFCILRKRDLFEKKCSYMIFPFLFFKFPFLHRHAEC